MFLRENSLPNFHKDDQIKMYNVYLFNQNDVMKPRPYSVEIMIVVLYVSSVDVVFFSHGK